MSKDRSRGEGGTYEPEVSDEDLLDVFRESEKPVLTAKQVAGEVSIGRKAVLERLRGLEERGMVERMEVGARAVVWWTVGDGE
ncbi:response regulator of citrate/malate metabolism [Natrialbaceae archaeon A-gly3]